MSRRIAKPYRCEPLADLVRQLAYAPPPKRVEQVRRAERLHDQIEPDKTYPLEFVQYRVTGYRADNAADVLLVGDAILTDLRLMIDTLSRSVGMPADDVEAETEAELATRLKVSTKTVARWRGLGLRWRWVQEPQTGQKRLMIPREASDRFLAMHGERVSRAARFTKLSPALRKRLLERARRIAEAREVSLNQVATHLAKRTGRAVETIRLLLEQHERENPDKPIFADHTGPLDARQKRVIHRALRMGVPMSKITRHFRRTRATIYRVEREHRAATLRRRSLQFVTSPLFLRDDADEVLLRPEEEHIGHDDRDGPNVDDLPEPMRERFATPPLDPGRQRSLLVRYNYLKFKAARLRDALDRYQPRAGDLDLIESWLTLADALYRRLLAANQPVILAVARQHLVGLADRSVHHLLELINMAQPVLAEAIETFDITSDQSFDAFLRWELMRRFASETQDHRSRAHRRLDPTRKR